MRSAKSTNFTGLALNGNDLFTEVYSGTATVDPASLLDGAGETVTITVTGAALGDFTLFAAPYSLQGITATSYVSAVDTVSVRLQNESGLTVDLASGTWKAKALR